MLNPIDHQNIVIRLLGMTSCNAAHLTTLAHSYNLPVSLHQVRVACDALVSQAFCTRGVLGYQLTAWGEGELAAVPLLGSYDLTVRGDS